MGLPGFKHFDVTASIYDEHWLFYEPEGLLLLGDFVPFIELAIDLPECLLKCAVRLGRCCGKSNMLNYTRSLVTNPDEVAPVVAAVAKLPIRRIEGVHDTDDLGRGGIRERGDARQEFITYWCWLLPANFEDE